MGLMPIKSERTIRVITAGALMLAVMGLLWLAAGYLAAEATKEPARCRCGVAEACPPECHRHAWWWNFPG